MNNIVIFKTKFEKVAPGNLIAFYEHVHTLTPLNQVMTKNSDYWTGVCNFTKLGASSRSRHRSDLLSLKIRQFAKRYVLYSQTLNRTSVINELKAIRAIDYVMSKAEDYSSILRLDSIVLDKAADVLLDNYSPAAAYHGGCHLEKLHDFLVDKKIIKSMGWKNPIPRASDVVEKVGKVGAENRGKKLPDENALLAIAEIFNIGEEQLSARDIFTTSCITLLLAAPARGSEIFCLPFDCIYETTDRDGNRAVGLRWYAAKGYGHEVEWIPDVMDSSVFEAVERLRNLTNDARKAAPLIMDTTGAINVEYKRGPSVDMPWDKALFCMFENHLLKSKSQNRRSLWMPTINTLSEDLKVTKKILSNGKRSQFSIFERHGYPSEYEIKSHQIRHLESSFATVNGMSSELLAKWAGRSEAKQNRTYNHTSPGYYNKQYKNVLAKNNTKSNTLMSYEVVEPTTLFELNSGGLQTYHQTDFGMCEQNLMMLPCARFRMCIGCGSLSCIKGNTEQIDCIKRYREKELKLASLDKEAVDKGVIGADRHYQLHLEQIKHCDDLLSMHSDRNIEDGSTIRLSSPNDKSTLDRQLIKNYKKRLPNIVKTAPRLPRKPT